ncbi:hypothetical protein AVL59_23630 [Streptomyces griseochromogenes]|uniref:Uncharacterized protein n=1 Tax=Streptomyces griseochromogenes TaxID=68214 RepID=A0A1B1B061_9ACTN|nr:hypothetical protein AVL59_23630 [Streptomyces griseochromogenes]
MDVVPSLPPDAQAAEAVQPGDRPFDDVSEDAQAGAVWLASPRDHGTDAALPQQAPVLVVVVTAVGEKCVGPVPGPADNPGDRGGTLSSRGRS